MIKETDDIYSRLAAIKSSKEFITNEQYIYNLEILHKDIVNLLIRPSVKNEEVCMLLNKIRFEVCN